VITECGGSGSQSRTPEEAAVCVSSDPVRADDCLTY
jgi:hypothetical protein